MSNIKPLQNNIQGSKSAGANIGSKIKSLMEHHKVSLAKVASVTDLTAETIRQIVNGTIKNPGIETLSKIATAFSISLLELLDNKDITSQINKKRMKVLDFYDLQKFQKSQSIDALINSSTTSKEILYISDELSDSDSFALELNNSIAEKLTNCGMPMLKVGDLLIFTKSGSFSSNTLILTKFTDDAVSLAVIMEIENKHLWVKSVDIPQKQIVVKVAIENIIGVLHNVQFSK